MANPNGNPGNKGGGRKSISQEFELVKAIDKFSPKFWAKLHEWIDSGDKTKEQFAMQEFNKVQVKRIPQDVTSGGDKLEAIPIYGGISKYNSNEEDISTKETD